MLIRDYRQFLLSLRTFTLNAYNQQIVIKKPQEIAAIRKACQITSTLYEIIIDKHLKLGVSEVYLEKKINELAKELGADVSKSNGVNGVMAFPTIIGSGPNSSFIHSIPSGRIIKEGDVVQFDLGVVYQGYSSDLSRVVFMGKKKHVSLNVKQAFKYVNKAQEKALQGLESHQPLASIAGCVDKYFEKKGVLYNYLHSLGHGVGNEIHEYPRITADMKKGVLPCPGMVFTIEPGLYFPGKFGVRVEDTVLVLEHGYESLTTARKDNYWK